MALATNTPLLKEVIMTNYLYAPIQRDYAGASQYGIMRRNADGLSVADEWTGHSVHDLYDPETRDRELAEIMAGRMPDIFWHPAEPSSWDRSWPVPSSLEFRSPGAADVDWATAADAPSAQEKLDALWARLGEEANSRDWCGEYDRFASELNGPPRPPRQRQHTVYVRVPVTITMAEHPDGSEGAIRTWHDSIGRNRAVAAVNAALTESTGRDVTLPYGTRILMADDTGTSL